MPDDTNDLTDLEFLPVTLDRLADLARFSERHGKFRWCSCMRWRLPSAAFQAATKAERIAALERLVRAGTPVGVLGYAAGEPIAWCSIAPRESYAALERSRTIPRIDDAPVWSVACFFVDRAYRRRGLTGALLQAAVAYARAQGAGIIEGYPVEPGATYGYMGSPSTFEQVGFRDVEAPQPGRRVMRLVVDTDEPRCPCDGV